MIVNMSTFGLLVKIIIALLVAGFVAFASGIIYDALFSAGDAVHNIENCNTLSDGWIDQCKSEKAKYESGKMLIQLAFFIGPLIIALLFIIKHL